MKPSTTAISTSQIDTKLTPEERAYLDVVDALAQRQLRATANRQAKMMQTNAIREANKRRAVEDALTHVDLYDKTIPEIAGAVLKYLLVGGRLKTFNLKVAPSLDFIEARLQERLGGQLK